MADADRKQPLEYYTGTTRPIGTKGELIPCLISSTPGLVIGVVIFVYWRLTYAEEMLIVLLAVICAGGCAGSVAGMMICRRTQKTKIIWWLLALFLVMFFLNAHDFLWLLRTIIQDEAS